MNNTITQLAEQAAPAVREFRRDFHAHPELAWCEMRTTSLIAARLRALGFDEILVGEDVCASDARLGLPTPEALSAAYHRAEAQGADMTYLPATQNGCTGVIGILRCGEGPTVALRFDIDALPIQETAKESHVPNQEGFRSQNPGVMHACGHDGHAAIGLGVAEVLRAIRQELHGTVKLIFQPGEEGLRGARSIVEKGHLDDVDYLLGAHITGSPQSTSCSILIGAGRTMASEKLDVTFRGKSSHAGVCPEKGCNAMLAAANAVLNLHAISRHGSGITRINVGKLTAGSGRNIICDHAVLEMEVRGDTPESNNYMRQSAQMVLEASAQMYGCSIEIVCAGEAKCNHNDPALTELVRRTINDSTDMRAIVPSSNKAGACEDFSLMAERVQSHDGQSCYFNNLVPCAGPFHSPIFDFNERALTNGVKAFSAIILELMGNL